MKKLTHICPEGMKTKIVITTLLLFSFCKISQAQFVTIPDANFVTYLQTNFPSAMSGNQMDTTDASILSATSVDITSLGISDLAKDIVQEKAPIIKQKFINFGNKLKSFKK